jgi:hypothetical protein
MRYAILMLLVLILKMAEVASAQCAQRISVTNKNAVDVAALTMSFAGFAPSISADVEVEPDLPPTCSEPLIIGDLLNTVALIWDEECVDTGSWLTIQAHSSEEIPEVVMGEWADLEGQSFPIPGEDFLMSPDCNQNCVADELDVSTGTSSDGNQNGVPDECEGLTEIPTLTTGGTIALALFITGVGLRRVRRSLAAAS